LGITVGVRRENVGFLGFAEACEGERALRVNRLCLKNENRRGADLKAVEGEETCGDVISAANLEL